MKVRRIGAAPAQRGQSLLLAVLLLAIGVGALVYHLASPERVQIEKDKITAAALAQAKTALIGYAAGVNLAGGERPGDLPCPDINDSGAPGIPNCNSPASRIGRLPWKHLGLPDLRDGDGERLWYAVSSNFKNNSRTVCPVPNDAGCLNSDSRGTITVRNSNGDVIHSGNDPWQSHNPNGIIAVVFAPGAVLQRQDTGDLQVRDCSGGTGCAGTGVCNSTVTAKCNPINYLDVVTSVPEDNAAFTDGSSTDGFINGPVRDAGGNVIVNDRLITITYNDLMPLLERRVAREAYNCLTAYAAASNGRYPWAASVSASASGNYSSLQGERFGRLPDSFAQTLLGLNSSTPLINAVISFVCGLTPALCMSNSWLLAGPPTCSIAAGTWWNNWKEHVFYGVAEAYQPAATIDIFSLSVVVPPPTGCGNCLTVQGAPLPNNDKRFTVVVAGKRLSAVSGGQPRVSAANKADSANYLEDENGNNSGTSYIYDLKDTTPTFNDILLYHQ